MRALALIVVVAGGTSARADSKTCIAKDVELKGAAGRSVVLCAPDGKACWSLAEGEKPKPGAKLPAAPPAPPAAEVREDGGKLSTCFERKCKPLGKKLAAAIAKAKTPKLAGTTDLAAVTVDASAWSVAHDRPLKLKAPADALGGGAIDAVGTSLVSSWTPCAGPCAQMQLYTSNGVKRGPSFPSGKPIMIDATRAAILPEAADNSATVIDTSAAKVLDSVAVPGDATTNYAGVRIDDETVAILVVADSPQVAWLHAAKGKKPRLSSAPLEICP